MTDRPKRCDEVNCTPVYCRGDYEPDEPFSGWCIGVRTGVLSGKERGIENVPNDVIATCWLIGSHSDAAGRHCFVNNLDDLYLQLECLFVGLAELGLLERTLVRTLRISNENLNRLVRGAVTRMATFEPHVIDIGDKFIEFSCSCGEIFFREWNHEHEGKYYKPNETDKTIFDVHRRLGHTVYYQKSKRVKKSSGPNKYWQAWPKVARP